MLDKEKNYSKIVSDLGLGLSAAKGQSIQVRNCWHFYTSGDSVEVMFRNDEEFRDGMNRIMSVIVRYDVLILAFVLMDTHVHFILYGEFDSCNLFIHDYIKLTSMYISSTTTKRKALTEIEISHQRIDDDRYLKTAICYVVKNPFSAGLPYSLIDYPWGSGALYFRLSSQWTSPKWLLGIEDNIQKNQDIRKLTKSRVRIKDSLLAINGVIVPTQYVAVDIVEQLFRSHKAYNYFLISAKDTDIESLTGSISQLSVPLAEMRENRRILSEELFGLQDLRGLNMEQRVRLARAMKSRYYCSPKQIARVCGLVFDEVKGLL